MAIKSPETGTPQSQRHGFENIFEDAEGVPTESSSLLPESDGEDIERVESWSQKPLRQGFYWIQAGTVPFPRAQDFHPVAVPSLSMNSADKMEQLYSVTSSSLDLTVPSPRQRTQ